MAIKVIQSNPRKLPPLNAIRAFEAAARTGGFQSAGAELNVSANAVGRLVKVLEDWLGFELFKRLPRGVVLTEAGRSYFDRAATTLDELAEATSNLKRLENPNLLTISAPPSFVARWLVPRLGRFTTRYPDIEVRVLLSFLLSDFTQVDVVVHHGSGPYQGLCSDLLMREDFFPVCSPALLTRGPPLGKPADLSRHVLLHYEQRLAGQLDWPNWLAAIGCSGVHGQRNLSFSLSHLALQAAADGQGVALAISAFLADDLVAGRLVRPLGDVAVRGPHAYFLVYPQAATDFEKVMAFRNWSLEEAADERA